jgi:type VI secretion system ImpA family protein
VEIGAYSLADWETACQLERDENREKGLIAQAEQAGTVTRERFLASAEATPTARFVELDRELESLSETSSRLDLVLAQKVEREPPRLRQLREVLASIRALIANLLVERGGVVGAEPEGSPVVEAVEHALGAGVADLEPSFAGSGIRSRVQAYRMLSEAADYLLRTEPHSPAPYLVKRAVAWGHKPLSEVLAEIVKDPTDLDSIYVLLGIARKDDA